MGKELEQYKILWDTLNNEMHRFWVRYNVLVTIQIVVSSYFFKDLKKIEDFVTIQSIMVIIFLIIISIVTWGIINRAINIYKFLVKLIKKFENDSNGLRIIKSISNRQLSTFSSPYAYKLALMIPYSFLVLWLSILIFIIDTIIISNQQ